ncbi:transferase hexapeptide (six repeat-containing protein) [Roseateles sp. YR242]|uniref:acyltransferase n=1 Tax=Roseateles sp. YR242 TaxID=1855305 RepID=UPI0008B45915|nr:acyltransferase [Roseateles sp. YR242]SEK57358.1 transferase hexapeptide (six repeat-containing protein) [Roseateles sp. YR242]
MKFLFYALALMGHDALKYLAHIRQRARWRLRGTRIAAKAVITTAPGTRLALGAGVSIGHGTILVVAMDPNAPSPRSSSLEIGEGTAVNEYCNLRAAGGNIRIGRQCLFGQFVTLVSSNHGLAPGVPMAEQPWALDKTDIEIGDDVWLGANSIVLPGVRIGAGAVVAGGAVVSKDIPAGEIWGGVPARRLSSRDSREGGHPCAGDIV